MVITREQINKVLEENKAGKLSHLYSVSFPWADKPQMLFKIAGKFIVYDFKKNQVVSTLKPKDGADNEDYCAASGNVAYTIGNNLYVTEKAVTNEPEGIVCGQTVHRNEFGINKGTFWSPKGNLLAFYRMDESMVTQYPLVDITARVGEVNNVRYPMAGMTSHQVKVGIYNPATGKSIYLNAGDPTDRYFTNISWSPDEKSLYLIEVNRDQNFASITQKQESRWAFSTKKCILNTWSRKTQSYFCRGTLPSSSIKVSVTATTIFISLMPMQLT